MLLVTVSWALLGSAAFAASPSLNPSYAKLAGDCGSAGQGNVWIFKQWHLAPSTDTRVDPKTPRPQSENQTAIFRQLDAWIQDGSIDTVLAEGCSGEIKSGFLPIFNGWDMETLTRAQAKLTPDEYAAIVSHVPLKLEVRHGDKLRSLCAEESKALTEHARAFSDARGASGFLTRLVEYRNDPKRSRSYREGAISAFKLEPGISNEAVISKLRKELGTIIDKIKEGFGTRNQAIVESIRKLPDGTHAALVVGGAHVNDLKSRLEKAGIGCRIAEPVGYAVDAEKTLSDFEKLTKGK